MSAQIVCDGCGTVLDKGRVTIEDPRVITGKRINGFAGGGLPDGDFDWCLGCAQAAFRAVKAKNNQEWP